MPSAHSAMVCAMTIAAARFYSINSPAFALAVVFAFVTMYDAMGSAGGKLACTPDCSINI